jgi:hypothetical protein
MARGEGILSLISIPIVLSWLCFCEQRKAIFEGRTKLVSSVQAGGAVNWLKRCASCPPLTVDGHFKLEKCFQTGLPDENNDRRDFHTVAAGSSRSRNASRFLEVWESCQWC